MRTSTAIFILVSLLGSSNLAQERGDQKPGTVKWKLPLGGNVGYCSPAIGTDGTIYFGSKDRNLYALYGESGGLAEPPWPMHACDLRRTGRAGRSNPHAWESGQSPVCTPTPSAKDRDKNG